MLAVEIDGGQHYEAGNREYDQKRTEELNRRGIEVLRFTNYDVDAHFDAVCMEIDTRIRKRIRHN